MRIKSLSGFFVNAIIVIATILLLAEYFTSSSFYSPEPTRDKNYTTFTWIDSHLSPIDDEVPDSLPYHRYKIVKDSVTIMRKLKNGDLFGASSYVTFGLFGTYSSNYCNNCKLTFRNGWMPSYSWTDQPVQYYLKLSGWELKLTSNGGYDSVKFHVENGQSYLRKLIADSTHTDKHGHIEKKLSYQDIPVPFRYHQGDNCLMIPINKSLKIIFDYIFTTFGVLMGAYFMVYVFGGIVYFLINVYRGQTFTIGNVQRLKLIGFSLAIYSFSMFLVNLCMPLVLHKYFTSDVRLSKNSLPDWKMLSAIIVFLVLYKAFVNGKKIKDEQDLVI